MNNLVKSRIFIVSFLVSYFAFFILTIFVFEIKKSGIGVGSMDYGFPFSYFHEHCFGANYDLQGLMGNVIFAGILSSIIAFGISNLKEKLSSPEFRAKWYL